MNLLHVDFLSPFVPPNSEPAPASTSGPGQESVAIVMSLGFTRKQAIIALKATVSSIVPLHPSLSLCCPSHCCQDNNVERAADWVFSHAAELDADMDTEPPAQAYLDGAPSELSPP